MGGIPLGSHDITVYDCNHHDIRLALMTVLQIKSPKALGSGFFPRFSGPFQGKKHIIKLDEIYACIICPVCPMCPSVLTGFALKTIVPKKVFNLFCFCFVSFIFSKVRRIIKINHFFPKKNLSNSSIPRALRNVADGPWVGLWVKWAGLNLQWSVLSPICTFSALWLLCGKVRDRGRGGWSVYRKRGIV